MSQQAQQEAETLDALEQNGGYRWGFVTDVEADQVPRGLSEDTVRLISARKREPKFLLDWRLEAFHRWKKMAEPTWQNVRFGPVDYQDIVYYSAPKQKPTVKSLEELDPEVNLGSEFPEALIEMATGYVCRND